MSTPRHPATEFRCFNNCCEVAWFRNSWEGTERKELAAKREQSDRYAVNLLKKSPLGGSRSLRARSLRGALALTPLSAIVLVAGCWSQLDDLKPIDPTSPADGGTGADGGVCPSEDTCGGGNCPLCGLGETCKYNSDCESRVCNGMCLPAGCGNKVRDEGESDVDCGGSCDPCADGKRCEQDPHCQSNVCDDGYCQEATCEDEAKNGDEGDVDCGGDCDDCPDGKKCNEDEDCDSGFCGEGTCADPSCGDNSINGSETDLNCGGDCPDCVAGKKCNEDEDCDSAKCEPNDDDELVCVASACDDGLKNGTESDEDCGGDCDPCVDGKLCLVGTDCANLVCEAVDDALTCVPATCSDERTNGGESGKDCGGETDCDRCPDDEGCNEHADCASNSCQDEVCAAPACDDGRKNQDEVGVDCGGDDCGGCPAGTTCTASEDCRSAHCDTTCLPGGASTECDDDAECLSGDCVSGRCAAGSLDTGCYENVDCLSNNCGSSKKCGPSGLGQGCTADADCLSASCDTDAGECLASAYSIKTSLDNSPNQQITFEVWVERGASDPSCTWGDFAMMYFFTPPPPANDEHNFVAKFYRGPDQARSSDDTRFIAREVVSDEWMFVWRARNSNETVIPTSPPAESILFQLHGQPQVNFTDASDFSYVAGAQVENAKVVVCQRVDGRWIHTQGQTPEFAPHPCDLIVDTCPTDGDLVCDVLERTD